MRAEEAYAECMRTDRIATPLRKAAGRGAADPAQLLAALAAADAGAPNPPAMPETRALLRELPARGGFPGAQYRLAGDRCVTPTLSWLPCTCVQTLVGSQQQGK